MTIVSTPDDTLIFPTAFICVAESSIVPGGRGLVGIIFHVPSNSTTAVPISVYGIPLSPFGSVAKSASTVTVAPTSPVPVIVGVASFVGLSFGSPLPN